jgi:HPt (histidine-containing phosphotransfer) domain-containing protein
MISTQHILNTGEGLERLMGDTALYRQLLLRFRKDYQDAVSQMRQLMTEGIPAAAQRKAHSLKGAAGMIGAQELHHLAGVTEAGLCASGQEAHAGLDVLEQALAALMLAITSYLDGAQETSASPTAPPVDTAAAAHAHPLVVRLAQLLDDGNGEAIDVLEQSATVLAACLGVAMYQEVAAAAHEFDFEAALAALAPALD